MSSTRGYHVMALVLIYLAGVWLFLNKHTKDVLLEDMYIDENGLMTSQSRGISVSYDTLVAVEEIMFRCKANTTECVIHLLTSLGMEVAKTCYPITPLNREPHFAEWIPHTLTPCVVTGVLRAPRGDGKESVVLATEMPYVTQNPRWTTETQVTSSSSRTKSGIDVQKLLRPDIESALKTTLAQLFNTSEPDWESLLSAYLGDGGTPISAFSIIFSALQAFPQSKAMSKDIVFVVAENVGHTGLRFVDLLETVVLENPNIREGTPPDAKLYHLIAPALERNATLRQLVDHACTQSADLSSHCPWQWTRVATASLRSPWFALDSLRAGSHYARLAVEAWLEEDVLKVKPSRRSRGITRQRVSQGTEQAMDAAPQFGQIIAALSVEIPSHLCPDHLTLRATSGGSGAAPNLDLVSSTLFAFGPQTDANLPSSTIAEPTFRPGASNSTVSLNLKQLRSLGSRWFFLEDVDYNHQHVLEGTPSQPLPFRIVRKIYSLVGDGIQYLSDALASAWSQEILRIDYKNLSPSDLAEVFNTYFVHGEGWLRPVPDAKVHVRPMGRLIQRLPFFPILPHPYEFVSSLEEENGLKRFMLEQAVGGPLGMHHPFLGKGIDAVGLSAVLGLTASQYEHALRNLIWIPHSLSRVVRAADSIWERSSLPKEQIMSLAHGTISLSFSQVLADDAQASISPYPVTPAARRGICRNAMLPQAIGSALSVWLQLIHNLHEKFHHSHAHYLLASRNYFLSSSRYQLIALVLTLPLLFVGLRWAYVLLGAALTQQSVTTFQQIALSCLPSLGTFLFHVLVLNLLPLALVPAALDRLGLWFPPSEGSTSLSATIILWISLHLLWYGYVFPRLIALLERRAWWRCVLEAAASEYKRERESVRERYAKRRADTHRVLEAMEHRLHGLISAQQDPQVIQLFSTRVQLQRRRAAKYAKPDPPHSLCPTFESVLFRTLADPKGKFVAPLAAVGANENDLKDIDEEPPEDYNAWLADLRAGKIHEPVEKVGRKLFRLLRRFNPSASLGFGSFASVPAHFRFIVRPEEPLIDERFKLPTTPVSLFSWGFVRALLKQLHPGAELPYACNAIPSTLAERILTAVPPVSRLQRDMSYSISAQAYNDIRVSSPRSTQPAQHSERSIWDIVLDYFHIPKDFVWNVQRPLVREEKRQLHSPNLSAASFPFRLVRASETLDWYGPDYPLNLQNVAWDQWRRRELREMYITQFGKNDQKIRFSVPWFSEEADSDIRSFCNLMNIRDYRFVHNNDTDETKSGRRVSEPEARSPLVACNRFFEHLFALSSTDEKMVSHEFNSLRAVSGMSNLARPEANPHLAHITTVRRIRRALSACSVLRRNAVHFINARLTNAVSALTRETLDHIPSKLIPTMLRILLFDRAEWREHPGFLQMVNRDLLLDEVVMRSVFAAMVSAEVNYADAFPAFPFLRAAKTKIPSATLGRLSDDCRAVNVINSMAPSTVPLAPTRGWAALLGVFVILSVTTLNPSLGIWSALIFTLLILLGVESYNLGVPIAALSLPGGMKAWKVCNNILSNLRNVEDWGDPETDFGSDDSLRKPVFQAALSFLRRGLTALVRGHVGKQVITLAVLSPLGLAGAYALATQDYVGTSGFLCTGRSPLSTLRCFVTVFASNPYEILRNSPHVLQLGLAFTYIALYTLTWITFLSAHLTNYILYCQTVSVEEAARAWNKAQPQAHSSDTAAAEIPVADRVPVVVGGVIYALSTFYPLLTPPSAKSCSPEPVLPVPDLISTIQIRENSHRLPVQSLPVLLSDISFDFSRTIFSDRMMKNFKKRITQLTDEIETMKIVANLIRKLMHLEFGIYCVETVGLSRLEQRTARSAIKAQLRERAEDTIGEEDGVIQDDDSLGVISQHQEKGEEEEKKKDTNDDNRDESHPARWFFPRYRMKHR